MKTKISIFGLLLIFFIFAYVKTLPAQVEKVDISVDGLACPFCAYGLEKKLKDIEGVGRLEINVDEGITLIESEPGESIDVDKIEPVVKDAGFTPKGIIVTAVGKIDSSDGEPFLLTGKTGQKFILRKNEPFEKLDALVKDRDKSVRVSGSIEHETPDKHHAHPYTLTIENFELME